MDLSPDIAAFVLAQRVARLATVDDRGRPHVVPICFAYEDGCVYSVLDAKPKRVPVERLQRVRNLAQNSAAQILLDRYDEDWTRLAYVQLRGRAAVLPAGSEQERAVALLREKYAQYRDMAIDASPVIRFEVAGVVAWADPADRDGDTRFA